jgi:hypothetical protein
MAKLAIPGQNLNRSAEQHKFEENILTNLSQFFSDWLVLRYWRHVSHVPVSTMAVHKFLHLDSIALGD